VLVHDYVTQRGGAERVVLSMVKAFPDAPLYTSLYDPARTFPEFGEVDIRTLPLNRIPLFRRKHRLAFPFLALAFSGLEISADVVLCSSSGWAHGVGTDGAKIVYCHSPARWLYQTERYLPRRWSPARVAVGLAHGYLMRWDLRSAKGAARYLANSMAIGAQIRDIYGIEAEVLPPPPPIELNGLAREHRDLEPGFFLCVARLLPYKNVDCIIQAFAQMQDERLIIVGSGPQEDRLRRGAPPNVAFAGRVSDDELRWLYANSVGVVAASYEDYGLTPLEGAVLGKPAAVLRAGGFLETVVEGVTGVFFDEPEPGLIRHAVQQIRFGKWDSGVLVEHAARYSEQRFIDRLRSVVSEAANGGAAANGASSRAATKRVLAL
jgi:glycosyltransferase involved in cell wall biosynthesis